MQALRQLLMFIVTALITFAFIGMMVVAHQLDQIVHAPEHAAALTALVT